MCHARAAGVLNTENTLRHETITTTTQKRGSAETPQHQLWMTGTLLSCAGAETCHLTVFQIPRCWMPSPVLILLRSRLLGPLSRHWQLEAAQLQRSAGSAPRGSGAVDLVEEGSYRYCKKVLVEVPGRTRAQLRSPMSRSVPSSPVVIAQVAV